MRTQGLGKAFSVANVWRGREVFVKAWWDIVLDINTTTASYKVAFKEGFVEKKKILFLDWKLEVCLTLVSEIVQNNHDECEQPKKSLFLSSVGRKVCPLLITDIQGSWLYPDAWAGWITCFKWRPWRDPSSPWERAAAQEVLCMGRSAWPRNLGSWMTRRQIWMPVWNPWKHRGRASSGPSLSRDRVAYVKSRRIVGAH